jgi:hypothetical protein
MPNRAARRAAARQALKLAGKASLENQSTVAPPSEAPELSCIDAAPSPFEGKAFAAAAAAQAEPEREQAFVSAARLAANRANSQRSTGPRTEEGKAKSSMNAVKTGLTGRTVLLPSDDAVIYQQHLERHFAEFAPMTDKEKVLVQSIADTEWRLLRIAPLEAGIYAVGRLELANEFTAFADGENREALIQSKIFMTYRSDLSNLALQERRLRNHREKDIAQLEALQKARLDKRRSEIAFAIKQGPGFNPADCGFDFSSDELRYYLDRTSTRFRLTQTRPDFDKVIAASRQPQKEAKAA